MTEVVSGHPPCIASRFLQKITAGRDVERQTAVLLRSLEECVTIIRQHAVLKRNEAEVQLLQDMEVRANTRRPSNGNSAMNATQPVGSGVRRLRDLAVEGGRLEDLVRHWEDNVLGRCDTLSTIITDASSGGVSFPGAFLELAKRFVDEVCRADWAAAPPHEGPWSSLKTFFDDELIRLGKQTRSTAGDDASDGGGISEGGLKRHQRVFRFSERFEWTGAPPPIRDRTAAHPTLSTAIDSAANASTAASRPSVRLGITCCCCDDANPSATTVYLGTERGLILALPWESFYPTSDDDTHRFHSRATQAALSEFARQRARMDEERAGLPQGRLLGVQHESSSSIPLEATSSSETHLSGTVATQPPQVIPDGDGFMCGPVKIFKSCVYGISSMKIISYHGAAHGDGTIATCGKLLVVTCMDKTIRVFNARSGAVLSIAGPERSMCGGTSYLPGPDALIAGFYDGSVGLWDIQSGTYLKTMLEVPCNAAESRRGSAIHALHVMPTDLATVLPVDSIGDVAAQLKDLTGSSFADKQEQPNSATCFIGCRNGHVYGFRLTTHAPAKQPEPARLTDDGSSVAVESITYALLPDGSGSPLLSCTATTCTCRGGHSSAVTRFASISRFLFSADVEGRIIKWDLGSGERMFELFGHTDDITTMCITCDGYLFSSSRDGLWLLWDAQKGTLLQRSGRHYQQVVGLMISHILPPAASASTSPAATASASSNANSTPSTIQSPSKKGRSRQKAEQKTATVADHAEPRRLEKAFECPPREQRALQSGSRECIALECAPASQSMTEPSPSAATGSSVEEPPQRHLALNLLTISRDDTVISWDITWDPRVAK